MNLHEMKKAQNTPISKINSWMEEKLMLSIKRARRKFFTRTTGVLRRRGFQKGWTNIGKARRSTRSRTLTRSQTTSRSPTSIVSPGFLEEVQMICFLLSQPLRPSQFLYRRKPGSQQREAGKKLLSGPGLRQVEVGPTPAKRHVGKQKPVLVDEGSSKRKKVGLSYPHDGEDELDRIAKEMRFTTQMNLKSLNPNLLLLHVHVVSKIQKVRSRN